MRIVPSLEEMARLLQKRAWGVARVLPSDDERSRPVLTELSHVGEAYPELPLFGVQRTCDDAAMEERTAAWLALYGVTEKILMLPSWWVFGEGRVGAVYKQSGAIVRDFLSMIGGKNPTDAVVAWIAKALPIDERGRLRIQQKRPAAQGGKTAPTAPRGQPVPNDPFRVLGVRPDATPAEIHHAYKTLVARHHPDRFAHLSRKEQEAAHRRIVIINQAYEAIRRRG